MRTYAELWLKDSPPAEGFIEHFFYADMRPRENPDNRIPTQEPVWVDKERNLCMHHTKISSVVFLVPNDQKQYCRISMDPQTILVLADQIKAILKTKEVAPFDPL